MRTKNIIMGAALALLSLVSCTQKMEYNAVPFVSLETRAATVQESDPATTWFLPVHLYNYPNTCTVTYTVEAVTATAGVDYELVDASGVLDFVGNDTKNIAISIVGKPGVYTGDLTFRVKLASATNGVTFGNSSTCTVTIKDLDHPLSALFGEYTMKAVVQNSNGGLSYPSWTMRMSQVEGSATKVQIDHISYFSVAYGSYTKDMPVVGTVSDDKKTISIVVPQETTGDASAFGYDDETFTLYAHAGTTTGEYDTAPGVITFTYNEASKVWTTTDGYGFSTPSDIVDYPDSFYYYAVVYSKFNAAYPTCFVKN